MARDVNSLAYFYGEHYFISELGDAGGAVVRGVTTAEITRQRIRQAIIDTGRMNQVLAASTTGVVETFAERWSRFYKMPFYDHCGQAAIIEECDGISAHL